jgi:hypothetical protein
VIVAERLQRLAAGAITVAGEIAASGKSDITDADVVITDSPTSDEKTTNGDNGE